MNSVSGVNVAIFHTTGLGPVIVFIWTFGAVRFGAGFGVMVDGSIGSFRLTGSCNNGFGSDTMDAKQMDG